MLDTAWEAVLSRLLPWEKQSRSEDLKQIDSESWHSQRLEHISLDRLLLQYWVAMAFEFGSWMSADKTERGSSTVEVFVVHSGLPLAA